MSLIFPRLAKNFAKNGYYPTDEVTLQRILNAIDTRAERTVILDPCCGEGVALAELKNHLATACSISCNVRAYGVEYESERAWHAKKILDVAAHADIHDMAIKARQFGAVFLNPPYGDLVADQAALSESAGGRARLEKIFFRKAHPWLAFGGVLVLIVPHYVLDAEFAALIAKSYTDVHAFMAPEKQFRQCVILARKRKAERLDQAVAEQLERIGRGALPAELPEHWADATYDVPAVHETPHFVAARITGPELAKELSTMQNSTLWPQFASHFGGVMQAHRPPLRRLSNWHLALALAAGQISGVVESAGGRKLLVKGDTYKDKTLKVNLEEVGKDGAQREVRVFTDRFVPAIRAFDFTPGPMYGHLVTIQ